MNDAAIKRFLINREEEYDSPAQWRAHLLRQAEQLAEAIAQGHHERRSNDRWFMSFYGALWAGGVALHTAEQLTLNINNGIRAGALIVLVFATVLWTVEQLELFQENSDRHLLLNLMEKKLPANINKSRWLLMKRRGLFGGEIRCDSRSREEQSARRIRARRIRMAVMKPLLFLLVSVVLLAII